MKKVYQTKFGCPGGNCFQAAVASLLEMNLEDVPDFANEDLENWWNNFTIWLQERNIDIASSLTQDKVYPVTCLINGYCLLGVQSKTDPDFRHSVVGQAEVLSDGRIGFRIVHDPYPGSDINSKYKIFDAIWIVKNAAQ